MGEFIKADGLWSFASSTNKEGCGNTTIGEFSAGSFTDLAGSTFQSQQGVRLLNSSGTGSTALPKHAGVTYGDIERERDCGWAS